MASNTDREMILADFQACTGIENIDEAITLLEQNNWDLLAAINGVIPQENGILQSEFSSETIQNPVFGPTPLPPPSAPIASSSSSGSAFRPVVPSRQVVERLSRMLDFKVEYRDKTADVVLEDSCTVGDIKQILENELQVPPSKMLLKGWKSGDVEDSTVLRTLHLPKHNNLYVLTPDLPLPSMSSQSSSQPESLNQNYTLIITHRELKREYNLQFSGSCTIQEVKRNVYDLTSIPVRHQAWEGWPPSAQSDSMTLASSGLNFPCHRLTVGRRTSPVQTREQSDECTDIHMISDSDGDDFEDATEFGVDDGEIFGTSSALRKSPMMPENADNEADALLQFTAEFSSRYGECHPVFFIGSLEASFQEAFYGKARERKLLAIYLHHDESVLTNVFCSQMLCAETIVSYLSQNFITWAWDMTREANRARFLTLCTRNFGSVAAQTIRTQKTDQFPLFLIIMGKRSSNEVLNVIQGNTSVDELMMRLISAMEIFSAQQQEDIKDEDEREARENVKREQDEAYRLSLEADRAKREAQEREMAEQYRLEQIKKEQEQEREAIRLSLEQSLPPEPPEEQSEPLSKLRIRTPSGEFIERRFLSSSPLQVVFNFVASKGFPCHEYKLLSTFPRRDITQLDSSRTLMDLKLYPQETLFLEAKE